MKKPELLVTPRAVADIEPLAKAGADAFVIGEQKFGLRLAGEFNVNDVKQAVSIAHENGKKVYVAMNAMFHNDKVDELDDYLQFAVEVNADAIIFGDPAVLMTVREVAPNMKFTGIQKQLQQTGSHVTIGAKVVQNVPCLHVNQAWMKLLKLKENAEVEIEVQVHGMTCMFQSKRSLLGNYFDIKIK